MIVPSPMVSRSVQMGTCVDKITTPPDLRTERPQVEVEQRRTREQHNGFRRTSVLTIQKRVCQAPDADRLRLPSTDQDPLRQDRNGE